jgi:soluble lytic murein transglycosylase-like protein
MRAARLAAALSALLMATAPPAVAAIIVLQEGGFIKVEEYALKGDLVKLALPDGGYITLPLSRVERIVGDELVPPGNQDPPVPPPHVSSLLAFDEKAPVPRTPYGQLMWDTGKRHQLNPALIAAMARAESAFDPRAVSPKGARGLMQIMPATGERFGFKNEHLFEPEHNIEAAARYLGWLRRRFQGDLTRMLAAYNAGEANVDRYKGVPPFRETRDYIRRVYAGLEAATIAQSSAQ